MHFEAFSFGLIRIDGVTYEHDVVIDRGWVRKRKKKPPRNTAPNSGTRRSPSKKKYREFGTPRVAGRASAV